MFVLSSLRPDRCVTLLVLRAATRSASSTSTHYDALGISPKATQADVKAAYYKLTKQYHPDMQDKADDGAEATRKFRQVTAAYEILGNVKLRRLYDKGMHHLGAASHGATSTAWQPSDSEDPSMRFYKSREVRSRPPTAPSGTPVYDFDEWSRQHYGATFMREQTARKRRQHYNAMQDTSRDVTRYENFVYALIIFILAICFTTASSPHADHPRYKRDDPHQPITKR